MIRRAPILAQAGARVIVPYLRGYGPTRFLKAETPRSGEQAALGADLLDSHGRAQIERAVLGGYDWGGRAACIVAALWPERVVALVSGNSYNIQTSRMRWSRRARPRRRPSGTSITSTTSAAGAVSRRTGGRSRASCGACGRRTGRSTMRPSIERRAPSTIPTSSTVVIHSYRHRYGLAPAPAIRAMTRSRRGSRRSRRSPFRRSPSTATPTA